MKTVLYSCNSIPPEWIAAHGFTPHRLAVRRPENSRSSLPIMGVCPYAVAFATQAVAFATQAVAVTAHSSTFDKKSIATEVSAIIVTTACDQMRRIAEHVAHMTDCPVFLMHVPTAADLDTTRQYYRDELERLGRFLERLGGTAPLPAHLADTMRRFDAARCALRAMRPRFKPRQFSEALMRFQQLNSAMLDTISESVIASSGTPSGTPICLLGGPLMENDLALFDVIEKAGGTVVVDATHTGERGLPRPFSLHALALTPFDELAEAYWNSLTEAFRRPNTALYEWLAQHLVAREVRGIIFRHYVWCDTWQAEAQRIREWTTLPVLVLDSADDDPQLARATSRITAFLEALQ